MKYITYKQKQGRSGHKLKDLMTTFIFSYFLDELTVCSNETWSNSILKNIDKFGVYKELENLGKNKIIIELKDLNKRYNGINFETFNNYINEIKKYNNEIIVLKSPLRVHLYQLHNWYVEGLIKIDYFSLKLIPLLRKIYYFNKNEGEPQNVFSIHIRRGDISNKMIKQGWDIEFYKNIINSINETSNLKINIYSELENSDDLLELKDMKNVNLMLGDASNLEDDIWNMVHSKYFLVSNSSLATWIAYLNKNIIFYPKGLNIKHFKHKIYPSNMYELKDLENTLKK